MSPLVPLKLKFPEKACPKLLEAAVKRRAKIKAEKLKRGKAEIEAALRPIAEDEGRMADA